MTTIQNLLWLTAFLIGGIAGWLDWKDRKVPNRLWVFGLALATPLLLMEAFQEPVEALIRWGCALVFLAVTWALWRTGNFGAADAKGFAFFGLILSPVGYYDVLHGKIYPAFDVLVTTMVLAEVFRRILQRPSLPFFTVSQWPLLLAPVAGGLIWWPIVVLIRFLV